MEKVDLRTPFQRKKAKESAVIWDLYTQIKGENALASQFACAKWVAKKLNLKAISVYTRIKAMEKNININIEKKL